MKIAVLMTCLLSVMTIPAQADSITIDGKTYKDVLVYESSKYYFVKLPREGRSISVAKSEVDVASVQLNEDPFYREDLRKLYDDVKLRGEDALGDRDLNASAFQLDEDTTGAIDTGALLSGSGGGGGGKPMNLNVDAAKAAFVPLQVEFTKSGSSWSGKSADGAVSVNLDTSGDKVSTITGNINATDQAAIQQKAMGVIQMMQKVAPWSSSWIMTNTQTLMTGGALEKTQDGVSISIQATGAGLSFTVRGA